MQTLRHLLVSTCLLIAPAWAAPAWQAELTSPEPGSFAKITPLVIDMTLSWKGAVNSGKVRMEFAPADAKKPGTLVVRSSSASTGAAAVLFPYHSNFWSELDPSTLRPRFFNAIEKDKKETVTTTVRHFPKKVESSEVTKNVKSGASKTTDRIFKFTPVFDVFSAMLHVRSQKLDTGDKIVLALHPFDTPYLLRINVLGREVHNGRDTIKLSVGLRKIDRKTLELVPYKKLKKDMTLWLSDDADRIPVELRADAFIGDVRATLTSLHKP